MCPSTVLSWVTVVALLASGNIVQEDRRRRKIWNVNMLNFTNLGPEVVLYAMCSEVKLKSILKPSRTFERVKSGRPRSQPKPFEYGYDHLENKLRTELEDLRKNNLDHIAAIQRPAGNEVADGVVKQEETLEIQYSAGDGKRSSISQHRRRVKTESYKCDCETCKSERRRQKKTRKIIERTRKLEKQTFVSEMSSGFQSIFTKPPDRLVDGMYAVHIALPLGMRGTNVYGLFPAFLTQQMTKWTSEFDKTHVSDSPQWQRHENHTVVAPQMVFVGYLPVHEGKTGTLSVQESTLRI